MSSQGGKKKKTMWKYWPAYLCSNSWDFSGLISIRGELQMQFATILTTPYCLTAGLIYSFTGPDWPLSSSSFATLV